MLHDVRDVLVASAADRAAAADYITWRVAHRDYFGFAAETKNRDDEEKPSAKPDVAAEIAQKTKSSPRHRSRDLSRALPRLSDRR